MGRVVSVRWLQCQTRGLFGGKADSGTVLSLRWSTVSLTTVIFLSRTVVLAFAQLRALAGKPCRF